MSGVGFTYDSLPRCAYKFTGKERDSETGLDYFGARYYGSTMGRFTSPDPAMRSAHLSDPQTWNRFSYVRNNPLIYVDDDGKELSLAPGLSKGDAARIKKALVEVYRKPGGARRIENLAKSDIKYVIGTGSLKGEGYGLTQAAGTVDPKTNKVDRAETTVTITIDTKQIDQDKADYDLGLRKTAPPTHEKTTSEEVVHADIFDANPDAQRGKSYDQKEKDAAPGIAELDSEKKGDKKKAEERVDTILKPKKDKD